MIRLLNAYFAILNIATNFWLIQNAVSFTKETRHLSENVLAIFQATA